MIKLSTADAVETTAFAVLREKGFELRVVDMGADKNRLIVARDKDHEFHGHSALEILGLLAVYQARGDDWHPTEDDVHSRTKFWDASYNETDRNS
ncbi:hypothetical protein FMN63_22625 [Stappia sp. BW2]|uniref:hypothetical protein n=1 Tax=Stappia sp. BW2 TaxID=2592622 RepID=UPI0011DE7AF8|nr:hypothetical protein [Stappia sp. BW2]TYC65218.1 hypothetical protein FMN63_22625 [Stappia sp. BW2]